MLFDLPQDLPRIHFRYRFDGGLFNLRRLRAKTLTMSGSLSELQYADDNGTPALSTQDLQSTAYAFSSAYTRFGLSVNVGKTKALTQPPPDHPKTDLDIHINQEPVTAVDDFPYLGSILESTGRIDKEVGSRIRAAHAAFGRLSRRVFLSKDLTTETKLMVFRAVVISTLLYGCETWVVYQCHIRQLTRFQQAKLRAILRISWEDRVTNNDVLSRAGMPSVEALLLLHRLRWCGHVLRMPDHRLQKQLLFGELQEGKRSAGGGPIAVIRTN